MTDKQVAQELIRIAKFIKGESGNREEYKESFVKILKGFRKFTDEYLDGLADMLMSRGDDDVLSSRVFKKQRDDVASAFTALDNALKNHKRGVSGL